MVKINKVGSFLIACSAAIVLSSCATTRPPLPPDALVKLPQKKIVKLQSTNGGNKTQKIAKERQVKLEMQLLNTRPTPIWIPPVISKVLIMPYIDRGGSLHSYQYVYLKMRKGKWLIGNYLTNHTRGEIDTPLDDTSNDGMSNSAPVRSLVIRKSSTVNSNNSNTKSFYNGAPPKHPAPVKFNTSSGGNSNYNDVYFNNTVNSMKQ